jgi:signal transduction histidine kinase
MEEECAGYLHEAYEGTLRMNRLIEALLNFSRLGRREPVRDMVDLCAIAREAAAELRRAEPERRVVFHIPEQLMVDGDANLLRVVIGNLFDNAWKFTGMREEGTIELGSTQLDGKQAFFVRDNGPGFEMADADRIFTPFERLHEMKEIGGIGIGLATVQRIIKRHGGKVWAEGEPGKGAVFYFTLTP